MNLEKKIYWYNGVW